MIGLRLGRWNSASGIWFIWTRVYWRHRWTPLCQVRIRYPHDPLLGFFREDTT